MKNRIYIIVALLLTGCGKPIPATETKVASIYSPTPGFTLTFTQTLKSTYTLKSTSTYTPLFPLINFDMFPAGEYLVSFLETKNSDLYSPAIYSINGELIRELPPVNIGAFSPNLHYLENLPFVIDLTNGNNTKIKGVDWCGGPSWSSDSTSIVAVCGNQNTGADIFYLSLDSSSVTQLTQCNMVYTLCDSPSISPDGKWIAYYFSVQKDGMNEENGLHIMDTACFSAPSTCVDDGPGMNAGPPYTWSPSGDLVAGIGNKSIRIYSVKDAHATFLRDFQMNSDVVNIAWSPSGKWIAASTRSGRFLVSVETGELTPLKLDLFYYWISVP